MSDEQLLKKYFPEIASVKKQKLLELKTLYELWNAKINVVSRKDFDQFFERHVLHSLSIAKFNTFKPHQKVLDIGTGGGFPGIPLAILFPETDFILVDSIGKKIKIVSEIATALGLKNVKAVNARVEDIPKKFHYVTNRAVAPLAKLLLWTKGKYLPGAKLISLKGGDLTEEIKECKKLVNVHALNKVFEEQFFETKKVVEINF